MRGPLLPFDRHRFVLSFLLSVESFIVHLGTFNGIAGSESVINKRAKREPEMK